MSSYLPLGPSGYLPYFLLLGAAAGTFNAITNYYKTWQTKEIYSGKVAEVTPLACRLFGTYTGVVSFIRIYAAYNITSRPVYDLAIIAHLVAFFHFNTEMIIFGSVKPNRASASPLIVSLIGSVWMFTQRGYYTGA